MSSASGWKPSNDVLKQSQWRSIITAAQHLPPTTSALTTSIERPVSDLSHNQSRIDDQTDRQRGLMISSGVVESANRRIVTVRLKPFGMFWSQLGAEAVMNLRACYLSRSTRWQDFWRRSSNQS